ncbi:SDR family NAD(P)-dependent oxidoreductase [Aquabacter spiritensis]|uniref:NAD(P)-dependent dehydrogenase (Short-subunit alcohol dehydrogenase family) n=1 Tax=Aquabacter spiritensis TaxID=933073 RepID=A0A4R3M1Y7_9HYPH|nr:SDR family oxidoreductase [Aquabacter spiritensis]TCT06209.1 NAD(P)-dependent dehydrogenase (short-subunit alcohol dehydrogenase family) [Aquabacter spiritensis]
MTERAEQPLALVTGGASGIGEGCARILLEKGWRVVVADIRAEAAQATADRIGAAALTLDVTDAAAVEAVAQEAEARFGPVDALVTSAGVLQPPTPPEDFALADFDAVVSVNLRGTYVTAVAFGTRMARRGRGAIVTIGSITAVRAVPLHAYGPTKAAVVSITQCLAADYARSGVRVNCISPGFVATPPLQAAIARGQRDPRLLTESAALGRFVAVEDVGRAAAFLLSDEASAITGINLPVDCGWLIGAHLGTYGGVRPARGGA